LAAAGFKFAQFGADRDGRARRRSDRREHAGRRCGHFDGDLVGFELAERFVRLHGVAHVLEPFGDRRFGDGFAQSRHFDFDGHCVFRFLFDG
jgi:hypothetical protein